MVVKYISQMINGVVKILKCLIIIST